MTFFMEPTYFSEYFLCDGADSWGQREKLPSSALPHVAGKQNARWFLIMLYLMGGREGCVPRTVLNAAPVQIWVTVKGTL